MAESQGSVYRLSKEIVLGQRPVKFLWFTVGHELIKLDRDRQVRVIWSSDDFIVVDLGDGGGITTIMSWESDLVPVVPAIGRNWYLHTSGLVYRGDIGRNI